MGFLGELVGVIGVFQGSLGMPASGVVFAFFIVFGRSTMGLRCEFVLLGGLPVWIVHLRYPHPFICTEQANLS
jgi:hypothetical protein